MIETLRDRVRRDSFEVGAHPGKHNPSVRGMLPARYREGPFEGRVGGSHCYPWCRRLRHIAVLIFFYAEHVEGNVVENTRTSDARFHQILRNLGNLSRAYEANWLFNSPRTPR